MGKFLCDHDLHCHTILSACCHDERQTPANMLAVAEAHGYSTLCITDHLWDNAVPGASEWYQPQDIAHVKQSLPLPKSDSVRFLFGCETDFCGGGKLGLRPDHFDEFSFVIIPPDHFHMVNFVRPESISEPDQIANLLVERLEEIACLPIPFHKVGIAHLTTGLINRGKNKYDVINAINQDRFFEAMRAFARNGAGIELNGACFGPTWQEHKEEELCLYRIAKQAGCKFYLGSDAHMQEKMLRIVEVLPEVVEDLGLTDADRFCLE